MKKILLIVAALLLPVTAAATPATQNKNLTTQISNSLSVVEKKVRSASVRVMTGQGHGTGGLINYKGMHLVLTAHHVADGALGASYLLATETERRMAVLVLSLIHI